MTRLQKIFEKGVDTSGKTNIVIVPGNNGDTLADQTCSHFATWLDNLVVSENKSTVFWIFRHDIRVDSLVSWFAYCEAGECLLQNLTSLQKGDETSDNDTVILIGHKMGSFTLKKALVEAHRNSHRPQMDALLNAIETLVMLGDPDLNPDNQGEWISLISRCLPFKALPKHLGDPQDARCLQHIAGCFEEFTLHSTLFQVSCAVESKRKRFLKFRAEDPRCICSATMTVRMWTTTDEEITVFPGEGDKKNCAFYPKSPLYDRLRLIPNFTTQSCISDTSLPSAVLQAQACNGPSTYSLTDSPVTELACSGSASHSANLVSMPSIPAEDTTLEVAVEVARGFNILSDISIESETDLFDDDNQYPESGETVPAEVNRELKEPPAHDAQTEFSQVYDPNSASIHRSVDNLVHQQPFSFVEPSRSPRRSPLLFMQVPKRDGNFFGRDEILRPLEAIFTAASVPLSGNLACLDSATLVVLHGLPGVGKSAIALELTYRTQNTFDCIFWLRCNSKLHLAQSFHEAAVSLGLVQDRRDYDHESSRQKLIAWLSATSSRWLLIFDDADDLQILSHFMPDRRHGSIVVTSRDSLRAGQIFGQKERYHNLHVGPFGVEDATKFIRSLAPYAFVGADFEILTTIAEKCDCLPLALRTAGTIISHRGSIQDKNIMETFEKHASRVLACQPSNPRIYVSLSSAALSLANVITFLDPYCIDDAILLGAQRYKEIPLSTFPMKDEDYFEAKNELSSHALLAIGANSKIAVHRVTARSHRDKLDPGSFMDCFRFACQLLEARWPSRRKMRSIVLGNWPEFDNLHSHVHELSSTLVERDKLQRELFSDSYLRLLFLSTWYNACRGNAGEDQVLVRFAHRLIARSQRRDLRLSRMRNPSTALPARLIDVGLDNTRLPRLVDTAGQTGSFVALSHCRPSRNPFETQLTLRNLRQLQNGIESSAVPMCVSNAIEFTRSLGVQYIWVDSLCVVQGDQEALSRMSEVYRSAILTIVAGGNNDEVVESCIDGSALEQPFSIFLDWSRPTIARSLSNRLFTWNISIIEIMAQELVSLMKKSRDLRRKRFRVLACHRAKSNYPDQSNLLDEGTLNGEQLPGAECTQIEVETSSRQFIEASHALDQGIHHVETGKILEALALFMKARDLVSAFQELTLKSWKMHAMASAHIALIFQLQNLPAMAHDVAEASLAIQSQIPGISFKPTLERFRLEFVLGSIYNALENPDESFHYYTLANTNLETLPEEELAQPKRADWQGVLNLKLVQHYLRKNNYTKAHALLQQSINHFQSQNESPTAHAHLARTLHWQSLVYEAQGSKIMGNAIKAAAKQTWIGIREAKGCCDDAVAISSSSSSSSSSSPSTTDFDEAVEVWYR